MLVNFSMQKWCSTHVSRIYLSIKENEYLVPTEIPLILYYTDKQADN